MPDEPDSPAPPVRPRPWWRQRRWLLAGGGAVAVAAALLAAVLVPILQPDAEEPEPEPVRLVREFLAAAAARDPERTLAVAGGTDPPTGERARFLDADAMSDQWEVREVALTAPLPSSADDARVSVTTAWADQTKQSSVGVERDGQGQWVIPDPFARIRILPTLLRYVDLNGQRVPYDPDVEEYLLLPGLYQPYPELPRGVQAEFEDQMLLPGEASTVPTLDAFAIRPVALTEAGRAAVQQAAVEYVDACAQSSSWSLHACPFGNRDGTSQLSGFEIFWDRDQGVSWSVAEDPVVTAAAGQSVIELTNHDDGTIRMRATVDFLSIPDGVRPEDEPPGGYPEPGDVVTVECPVDFSMLHATFTATGEVAIAAGGEGHAFPDPPDDRDIHFSDTCYRATLAPQ